MWVGHPDLSNVHVGGSNVNEVPIIEWFDSRSTIVIQQAIDRPSSSSSGAIPVVDQVVSVMSPV